jgi:hypothetical protein
LITMLFFPVIEQVLAMMFLLEVAQTVPTYVFSENEMMNPFGQP